MAGPPATSSLGPCISPILERQKSNYKFQEIKTCRAAALAKARPKSKIIMAPVGAIFFKKISSTRQNPGPVWMGPFGAKSL
jgi:hypothetical protein